MNGTGGLVKAPRSAGYKYQACTGRYQTTDPHYSEVAPSGRSGQKGRRAPKKKLLIKHEATIYVSDLSTLAQRKMR